ncbi:MAG: protein kinase, partial [Chloroflexi bacterium]|nr:protein kinase [Chloroflexota bacterium]
KAYEPALDRYVAIKVLPQFFARDPNFIQRFRREAKAIAQLDHPNIVPIYSFGEEGDITYIAMRHVKGGTLKQQRGQVYGPEEAVRLLLHVARALEYAHQEGVVHRDVKPSNVLMSKRNWPLLTDFGLAKMAEASTQLTGTGVGVGTPMYMSPEQGQGSKDVDQRTDIYSLGIMLYEMLTGDVPFRADTPMGVVIKHITAPMPMPREVNPDIPEILERIILKATAKDPVDRYQTAEEMVISLERALNEMEAAPKVAQEISVAAPEVIPPRTKPVVQKPLKKKSKVGIILKIGFMGIGIIFCLMIVGGVIYGGIQGVQDAFATPTPSVVSALMPATETQSPDTKPTSTTAITETRAPTSIPFSSFEWPLVFSDTFDENVNNWPTGVDDDEFARCDWSITDGKYRWDAEAHQGFNWHVWPDAREASDLNLTVDARQISGPEDALYGVVFRMSDSDNFYLFGLSNYQSFTFRRKYEGEWEILIDWTENTNIRPGKANQITIVAMGSHFTFLINDQLVAEADDDVMFFGKAGLSIELYGEGDAAVFEFDNFELRAPEGVGFMEFITCLEDAA